MTENQKCPHSKYLDEECLECEAIWEASGFVELLDALEKDEVELPASRLESEERK